MDFVNVFSLQFLNIFGRCHALDTTEGSKERRLTETTLFTECQYRKTLMVASLYATFEFCESVVIDIFIVIYIEIVIEHLTEFVGRNMEGFSQVAHLQFWLLVNFLFLQVQAHVMNDALTFIVTDMHQL